MHIYACVCGVCMFMCGRCVLFILFVLYGCACMCLKTHIAHCWLQKPRQIAQDFIGILSILIKYTILKAQCILSVSRKVLCLI